MALQGSLDDFNIVNILQMVKLESKTGRLTLTEGDDLVKITFDNGAVIYAESAPQREEKRIELIVLSNGLLDRASWDALQKEHRDKLKPYWELLARHIQPQTLLELIKRSVLDNIYYALRWKRGTYDFTPMKGLKYNDKVMTPMDVDALLMEGCRIADEWPRTLASIPPLDTFVVKNIIMEDDEGESLATGSEDTGFTDYKSSLEYEILSARGVALKDSEVAALAVIGRGKTIQDILDAARQGHFTTLGAVQSLLRRGLVQPAQRKKKTAMTVDHGGKAAGMIPVILLATLTVGGFLWQIVSLPSTLETQRTGMKKVNSMQASGGLKKIDHAMKIYASLNGKAPGNLDNLVKSGLLTQGDIVDPWNRQYQLAIRDDKFALYSTGPDVFLANDDVYYPKPETGSPAPQDISGNKS